MCRHLVAASRRSSSERHRAHTAFATESPPTSRCCACAWPLASNVVRAIDQTIARFISQLLRVAINHRNLSVMSDIDEHAYGPAHKAGVQFFDGPRRREAAGGRSAEGVHNRVTISALTSADGEGTHHAHFRLRRHRLSDRLTFGASTDGCGRNGDHSSCNTRWNAIAVSARRGSTEPRRLTSPILLGLSLHCQIAKLIFLILY
jgi:hypothetical protein